MAHHTYYCRLYNTSDIIIATGINQSIRLRNLFTQSTQCKLVYDHEKYIYCNDIHLAAAD